jgi:hypothetical protein
MVIFEDDMDGSEAEGTVTFGLNGTQYELDLSKKNAEKLAMVFGPYVAAARKVTRSSRTSKATSRRSSAGGPSPQEVRAWAREQGIQVADKGRVPAELIVRFQAADTA